MISHFDSCATSHRRHAHHSCRVHVAFSSLTFGTDAAAKNAASATTVVCALAVVRPKGGRSMKERIWMPRFVRSLTLAATAVLLLSAVPQRAQAMLLITPGATPAAKAASDGIIQVHGGRGGGGHGGGGFHGGGFHGGGFHGGGFHGGGFHGGGGWHGGGFHGGGFRYGGFHHYGGYHSAHFHHRHFFHGGYYPYYGYYHHPHCRIIRTYYGWRRVCGGHRWHHRRYYW
jgi:hypothetical protein